MNMCIVNNFIYIYTICIHSNLWFLNVVDLIYKANAMAWSWFKPEVQQPHGNQYFLLLLKFVFNRLLFAALQLACNHMHELMGIK